MTASLPMPLDVEMMLKNYHWTHGEFLCDFWALTYLIAAPASILNLLAVTVVRYRAISRPLQYSLLVTPQRALGVIACVWLYTILFAVIGLTQWPYRQQSIMDGLCIFNVKPLFSNTINIVNFMLPTLIVCVLYFKIYQIAQAHARRICRFEIYSESTNDGTSITAERKAIYSNIQAAKTIAIIVFTFLTCWMPYNLLSLVKGFWYDLNIPYEVQPILILLAYTNSAMNPFVYAYRNREFRESFRRLFKLQTTWVWSIKSQVKTTLQGWETKCVLKTTEKEEKKAYTGLTLFNWGVVSINVLTSSANVLSDTGEKTKQIYLLN